MGALCWPSAFVAEYWKDICASTLAQNLSQHVAWSLIYIYINIYTYIYIYIRLSHEMGLERRVTLILPPLVPSYPSPERHFECTHFDLCSLKSAQKWIQKRARVQPRFWMDLDSDFDDLCYKYRSKILPKFMSVSSLVSKSIFASNTKDLNTFKKPRIL